MPILSICIPTFNRPEMVYERVSQIVNSCYSKDLEIIISDNSLEKDTEIKIKEIKDKRVKYFKNGENLGFGVNFLKSLERAKGEYLFILWDDDYINVKMIPWIIQILKKNREITYMTGSLDRRNDKIYYPISEIKRQDDLKFIKPTSKSIGKLFFSNMHGGGTVVKKKCIDINQAKKYLGTAIECYIHQIIATQAIMAGTACFTGKVLYYATDNIDTTRFSSNREGEPYWQHWDFLNRIHQLKMRINFSHELTSSDSKYMINVRSEITNKNIQFICNLVSQAFWTKPTDFLKMMQEIGKINVIVYSKYFWSQLLINITARTATKIQNFVFR